MAVDPMIARGGVPVDVTNTLAQIAQMRQRDQMLQMDQRRNALAMLQQDREAQREAEEDALADSLIDRAKQAFDSGGIKAAEPFLFDLARVDPDTAKYIMQAWKEKDTGTLYQTAEGFLPANQAIGKMPYQAPQRAPLRAPEGPLEDQRFLSWYEGLSEEQRAAYDRGKGRANRGGGSGSGGFESSDTNAIRGLVTTAFNGVYDPITGNISGIRREDMSNLNKVTARASQIYQASGGQKPHAVAVEEALTSLQSGGNATPAGSKPAPAGGRQVAFQSQQQAEAALAGGKLQRGDTVVINGKPAFRVE